MKWTPGLLLIFLTLINWLNYVDRGIIAGVLPYLEEEFDLNKFRGGVLSGCFIFGYMLACPTFAYLDRHIAPMRLITIGLFCWIIATALAGFAPNFYILVVARTLTGIGEASFCSLSPIFVDSNAPADRRTKWLAFYFMAMFIGQASGYIMATELKEAFGTWRGPFYFESLLMLPLMLLTLVGPTKYRLDSEEEEPEALLLADSAPLSEYVVLENEEGVRPKQTFLQQVRALMGNSLYLCIALGYSSYTFVIGSFSYWGPTFLNLDPEFKMDLRFANMAFGASTVVCGLLGTAFGGWLQDTLINRHREVNDQIRSLEASKISTLLMVIGAPLVAGTLACSSVPAFFVGLLLSEFCLFATAAPINAVLMTSVEDHLRSQAMGFSVLLIHLLGDFPSPMVTGAIADWTTLRTAMLLMSSWNVITIALWSLAWLLCYYRDDLRGSIRKVFTKLKRRRRSSAEVAGESSLNLSFA
eukprot:GILI01006725.1.p1 GENE.GILI01006725.1~~GILI01006725.1.p1  ORF type:complete len:471 (+),score=154.50 GILI01006725.1:187-1599(+)